MCFVYMSFFSEKNGLFCEDWILATTPPLHGCELDLHLNGMVHLFIDKYSSKIEELNKELQMKGMATGINEMVIDIVESVRENPPPLPDLNDEKIFKFYFELLNKDYNIRFSSDTMKKIKALHDEIDKDMIINIDDPFIRKNIKIYFCNAKRFENRYVINHIVYIADIPRKLFCKFRYFINC